MQRPLTVIKHFVCISLLLASLTFLVTSPDSSPLRNEASTAIFVGNISAFASKLRSGPWVSLSDTQSDMKQDVIGGEDHHRPMDIMNPFGQQAAGNKTYVFADYFDYEDLSQQSSNEQHSLAVIVPFRDAHHELRHFLPHMRTFLQTQNISHKFYVIEQEDKLRFNRGSLVNVGFLEVQRDGQCDYFAMHDVDLLPLNPMLGYRFDGCREGPLHLASPKLHPQYSKIDFIGAVLLMTNEQYLKVNGMSNVFWGWGREDEELRIRLRRANLKIFRPSGLNSTKANSFLHIHKEDTRRRDKQIIGDQYKVRFQLDTVTGLNTTMYRVVHKATEQLQGVPFTHIRVELECNTQTTPWCISQ